MTAAFAEALFENGDADDLPALAAEWDRAAFRLVRGHSALTTVPLLNRYPAIRWEIASVADVEARHGPRRLDPAGAFMLPDPAPRIDVSDRKSTRLNSSH